MRKIKRYVGIDPSSVTGFYIQDGEGKTVVEADVFYEYKVDPERMIHIADTIIEQLNINTDIICIEGFSYDSKGRGIAYQFGMGYVLRENLQRNGFTYYEVTPSGVKKFATGNGRAKKEHMIEPIRERFGFYHPSDNIRDAYVLSEIAKAIDLGKDYNYINRYESDTVYTVKNGVLNSGEWKKTKLPDWMNPRSKYYFTREQ